MGAVLPQVDRGNGVCEVAIGFGDLALERAAIVAGLGYLDGAIPEHFAGLLDSALAQAAAGCVIRAGFRLVAAGRVEGRPDAFALGGTVFAIQKIVAGQLGRADHAAVFAGTIGPGLEQWARQAMADGDPARGFIADAVASAVAEAVADRLQEHIGQEMTRRGWRITNRYSPGYCGWSVAEQHQLFALLPAQFCGITLGESGLMHPMKSVSGIVGVGAEVKYADYLCDVCGVRDCTPVGSPVGGEAVGPGFSGLALKCRGVKPLPPFGLAASSTPPALGPRFSAANRQPDRERTRP